MRNDEDDFDGQVDLSGLSTDEMLALGFRHVPGVGEWYLMRFISYGITLNFTIRESDGMWEEFVMDESAQGPAYYGRMAEDARRVVQTEIDMHCAFLQKAGLDLRVDHALYLVPDEETDS